MKAGWEVSNGNVLGQLNSVAHCGRKNISRGQELKGKSWKCEPWRFRKQNSYQKSQKCLIIFNLLSQVQSMPECLGLAIILVSSLPPLVWRFPVWRGSGTMCWPVPTTSTSLQQQHRGHSYSSLCNTLPLDEIQFQLC